MGFRKIACIDHDFIDSTFEVLIVLVGIFPDIHIKVNEIDVSYMGGFSLQFRIHIRFEDAAVICADDVVPFTIERVIYGYAGCVRTTIPNSKD